MAGQPEPRQVAMQAYAAAPRRRTPRRWVGVVILVCALVAAVGGPALISPGWKGTPSPIPLPTPPAVGGCVTINGVIATDVDCTGAHDGEIVRGWSAGLGPVPDTLADRLGMPVDDVSRASLESKECWPEMGAYLGSGDQFRGDRWQPISPNVGVHYLVGPGDPTVGSLRWSACVATAPIVQSYLGNVRNALATATPHWPSEFGTCIVISYHYPDVAGCERTHRAELLGFFVPTDEMVAGGSLEIGSSPEQAQAGCLRLATVMTGAADPTYGGQLRISSESINGLRSYRAADSNVPIFTLDLLEVPMCVAEVVGDGILSATVVGFGDRPLVWAN